MVKQLFILLLSSIVASATLAAETGDYAINPGDTLEILVWNEEALSRQVVVRPDGFVSLPLAGEFRAAGQSPSEVGETIALALANFLNDKPVVTVSTISLAGNLVYVLGKVNRPGAFPIVARIDVTQALAWAGGLNAFADEKDILVLRRDEAGIQTALSFNYAGVKSGKSLQSNIVLKSGDVVIVP